MPSPRLTEVIAAPSGSVVGRYPLVAAAYQRCSRTLGEGEVKRVSGRGPLVGYFLACPACGFVASYLHDAAGFEEEPAPPGVWPRRLVGIQTPPPCFQCGSLIGVEAGALVARRP
jgi:hypothetical protein